MLIALQVSGQQLSVQAASNSQKSSSVQHFGDPAGAAHSIHSRVSQAQGKPAVQDVPAASHHSSAINPLYEPHLVVDNAYDGSQEVSTPQQCSTGDCSIDASPALGSDVQKGASQSVDVVQAQHSSQGKAKGRNRAGKAKCSSGQSLQAVHSTSSTSSAVAHSSDATAAEVLEVGIPTPPPQGSSIDRDSSNKALPHSTPQPAQQANVNPSCAALAQAQGAAKPAAEPASAGYLPPGVPQPHTAMGKQSIGLPLPPTAVDKQPIKGRQTAQAAEAHRPTPGNAAVLPGFGGKPGGSPMSWATRMKQSQQQGSTASQSGLIQVCHAQLVFGTALRVPSHGMSQAACFGFESISSM